MKFDKFWAALCKKTSGGFEFQTLAKKYPFTATFTAGKIMVKVGNTNGERPLPNSEFYKVWVIASKLPKYEVFRPRNYHDTYHSSYTTSMMKTILGEEEIEE